MAIFKLLFEASYLKSMRYLWLSFFVFSSDTPEHARYSDGCIVLSEKGRRSSWPFLYSRIHFLPIQKYLTIHRCY